MVCLGRNQAPTQRRQNTDGEIHAFPRPAVAGPRIPHRQPQPPAPASRECSAANPRQTRRRRPRARGIRGRRPDTTPPARTHPRARAHTVQRVGTIVARSAHPCLHELRRRPIDQRAEEAEAEADAQKGWPKRICPACTYASLRRDTGTRAPTSQRAHVAPTIPRAGMRAGSSGDSAKARPPAGRNPLPTLVHIGRIGQRGRQQVQGTSATSSRPARPQVRRMASPRPFERRAAPVLAAPPRRVVLPAPGR